jgi:hypothetical protein
MDQNLLGKDLARYFQIKQDLKTLLEEIKNEDLPFPLGPDQEAAVVRSINMISSLVSQCEADICEMIDELDQEEAE